MADAAQETKRLSIAASKNAERLEQEAAKDVKIPKPLPNVLQILPNLLKPPQRNNLARLPNKA